LTTSLIANIRIRKSAVSSLTGTSKSAGTKRAMRFHFQTCGRYDHGAGPNRKASRSNGFLSVAW
jgi:hypothetical protein